MDARVLRVPAPVLFRLMETDPLLRRGGAPASSSSSSSSPTTPTTPQPPGTPPQPPQSTANNNRRRQQQHPLEPIIVILRLCGVQLVLLLRFLWAQLLLLVRLLRRYVVHPLVRAASAAPGWVRARLPDTQDAGDGGGGGGGGGTDGSGLEAQNPPKDDKGKNSGSDGGGGGGGGRGTSKEPGSSKTEKEPATSPSNTITPGGDPEATKVALQAFPSGRFARLPVSGQGLLCGPRAVMVSVKAQMPPGHLAPSVRELRQAVRLIEEDFGIDIDAQTSNYTVDRLGAALHLWGREMDPPLEMRLGFVLGNGHAYLVPTPDPKPAPEDEPQPQQATVWICSNNASGSSDGSIDHYEGMGRLEDDG
ncbi:hypothetical protein F5X99DRAFT_431144 [Biscogniauxia marginata]|nr:hypothetical protein F5X99DRAFT_431144 [Biscogniauxia marginata]